MTDTGTQRAWTILRQRVAADVIGLPVVWAIFLLGVALIVAAVALLGTGTMQSSGWEEAAQITRWYTGGVGVYLTAVYLPLYVTHGYTRREFATQLPAFVAVFAAVYALLMAVGFGIEALAYRAFGWSQALSGTHLFDTPTQYGMVFAEFWLLGGVWTVAGAMLGAAFYRRAALGLVLVPAALFAVALVETAAGTRYFGPIPAGDSGSLPLVGVTLDVGAPGLTAGIGAAVLAAGLAALWALVRDLPIRSGSA